MSPPKKLKNGQPHWRKIIIRQLYRLLQHKKEKANYCVLISVRSFGLLLGRNEDASVSKLREQEQAAAGGKMEGLRLHSCRGLKLSKRDRVLEYQRDECWESFTKILAIILGVDCFDDRNKYILRNEIVGNIRDENIFNKVGSGENLLISDFPRVGVELRILGQTFFVWLDSRLENTRKERGELLKIDTREITQKKNEKEKQQCAVHHARFQLGLGIWIGVEVQSFSESMSEGIEPGIRPLERSNRAYKSRGEGCSGKRLAMESSRPQRGDSGEQACK
ncbi:hypothetical protein B0H11DRAFT_1932454 [Mycena galericulata]|nr:hypothetical protein B0H11DRAFT_1932454 [Mycena galericulata]